ncbi:four helix bundle protein [Phycisphaeraceae bacterium D3-23]
MAEDDPKYDLAERTAKFGESSVRFARTIQLDAVTDPLIRQMVRAATSVGANYAEADEAGSKKEFRYRISLCSRESRESKHWLRMIGQAVPDAQKDELRKLWKEADELARIFASIYRSSAGKA